jgi:hypothetical protein
VLDRRRLRISLAAVDDGLVAPNRLVSFAT